MSPESLSPSQLPNRSTSKSNSLALILLSRAFSAVAKIQRARKSVSLPSPQVFGGMVKRGAVSQKRADRQLNGYKQLLEREPFGPAPQDSVAEPDDKRHTALVVRANARALREAAAAFAKLDAGAPPGSVEIPPGVIINPTNEKIAEECRRWGLKPPATLPKKGPARADFHDGIETRRRDPRRTPTPETRR